MKKKKLRFYKIICVITSLVFIYSFSQHLFISDSFLNDLGLTASNATSFLAHRLSVFPLGLAVLLFLVKNLSHSKCRQYICISMGFLFLSYACIGGYELIIGSVNKYMLVPIVLEAFLGISFLSIFFNNRMIESN